MTDNDTRIPFRADKSADESAANGLSRRQALKRGVLVTGAVAWTVPMIQVVAMSPAHAENVSAPPANRPKPVTHRTVPKQEAAVPPSPEATPSPAAEKNGLAATGSPVSLDQGLAAGAGLLIAGSAAAFLARSKGGAKPTDSGADVSEAEDATPDTV